MPTFSNNESSRSNGRPIEIYKVAYGRSEGAVLRMTDSPVAVTVDGEVYTPATVTRTSAQIESNGQQSDIKITVGKTTALAQLFQGYPPSSVVGVVVRQGHIPDDPSVDQDVGEWPIAWTGTLTESLRDGPDTVFTGKAPVSDLETPGLRLNYQWSCAHVLYEGRCNASRSFARTTATVAAVSVNTVSFSDETWRRSDAAASDYIGGYITWEGPDGTDFASIQAADATSITVVGSMRGLGAATSVMIYLGCSRNLDACNRLHGNIVNFGGQPWIPTDNPLDRNNFG